MFAGRLPGYSLSPLARESWAEEVSQMVCQRVSGPVPGLATGWDRAMAEAPRAARSVAFQEEQEGGRVPDWGFPGSAADYLDQAPDCS